jgi:hypothetical protein
MAFNNFTVGRDVSVVLFDNTTRAILNVSEVTDFDCKQDTNDIKVKPITGEPVFLKLPDGWSGSLGIERRSPVLDNYIAGLEAAYYSGTNIIGASITETITEPDGTISQYRFTGVAFKMSDGGKFSGDTTVKMKLDFSASRRLKVA